MIAEWKISENQRDLREKSLTGLYFDGNTNLLTRTYAILFHALMVDGKTPQMIAEWKIRENPRDLREKSLTVLYSKRT